MKKNGDSRTSFLSDRPTTTHLRRQPLIDPMVLIILIPPILVLLFLFLLTYVPNPIKPTSFKSTFNSFILFLILLASLFRILNHEENEFSTNMMVENEQHQDVKGVDDESSFYDAVNSPCWDEVMDVAGNSDDQRTSTPPPEPWIYVNYHKLDRPKVSEDTTERGSSYDQSYRDRKRRIQRRKAKNIRRAAPYIPPAPPPPPPAPAPPPPPETQISPPPKAQAPAPVPVTNSTPFIKNLKKIFTPGNKNKKHPSSKTSKLPPLPPTRPPHQPEPQHNDQNRSSSSTSHSSWTPPPARSRLTPQPQPEPRHYDRQSSMNSTSQSSYIPEPPPLPPFDMPEMRYKYYGDFVRLRSFNSSTSTSSNSQSSWTPTPSQPKQEPQHYYRQSSIMSSSSQSSYIPEPPPLPPFDMPANRYKYIGEYYARLRSYNSNTSSSPDLQPMAGQPSTSMESGDSFWYSPDVNAKAGIFISKGKDKWKMEQENSIKNKGGTSFINKPRKSNLNSMKSHFDP